MDINDKVTIGEAARLGRVTVRTLHHYDAIGLLRPANRTVGDYRLYSRADLERLHQIRLYREIDMPLAEIQTVLDDPNFDRHTALTTHRERLQAKAASVQELLQTIDRLLNGDEEMNTEDLFDGFEPEEHAAEVQERWGETAAFETAQKRTKSYSPERWREIHGEHKELLRGLANTMTAGQPAESPEAMDHAEALRLHMDRWYYPVTKQAHCELGGMYLEDARFKETYESVAPGLASYLVAAIQANGRR